MKQHKNLWKMLLSAAVVAVAGQANAQEFVIGAAGTATDSFCCTVGEVFVGENAGLFADAYTMPSGVEGVYVDGDVEIAVNGNGTLNIVLPQGVVADGAYYCIYDLSGRVLRQAEITSSATYVDYTGLQDQVIIITVTSNKAGRISTLKLVK